MDSEYSALVAAICTSTLPIDDDTVLDSPAYKSLIAGLATRQVTFTKIIQYLGPYLTSTDEFVRTRGTLLVSSILEEVHESNVEMSPEQCSLLATFMSNRLADLPAVTPVLRGVVALFTKLPVSDTDVHNILKTLGSDVQVQSFRQRARALAFRVLHMALDRFPSLVRKMGADFVVSCVHALDGERDPRNLLLVFPLISRLCRWFCDPDTCPPNPFPEDAIAAKKYGEDSTSLENSEAVIETFAEEFFEVISCYFPITFTPPPDDKRGITKEGLSSALQLAALCHPSLAQYYLPFFLDKLASTVRETKIDTLLCLQRAFSGVPHSYYTREVVLPFMRELFSSLKTEILRSSDDEIVDAAIATMRALCALVYTEHAGVGDTSSVHVHGIASAAVKEVRVTGTSHSSAYASLLRAITSASRTAARCVLLNAIPELPHSFLDISDSPTTSSGSAIAEKAEKAAGESSESTADSPGKKGGKGVTVSDTDRREGYIELMMGIVEGVWELAKKSLRPYKVMGSFKPQLRTLIPIVRDILSTSLSSTSVPLPFSLRTYSYALRIVRLLIPIFDSVKEVEETLEVCGSLISRGSEEESDGEKASEQEGVCADAVRVFLEVHEGREVENCDPGQGESKNDRESMTEIAIEYVEKTLVPRLLSIALSLPPSKLLSNSPKSAFDTIEKLCGVRNGYRDAVCTEIVRVLAIHRGTDPEVTAEQISAIELVWHLCGGSNLSLTPLAAISPDWDFLLLACVICTLSCAEREASLEGERFVHSYIDSLRVKCAEILRNIHVHIHADVQRRFSPLLLSTLVPRSVPVALALSPSSTTSSGEQEEEREREREWMYSFLSEKVGKCLVDEDMRTDVHKNLTEYLQGEVLTRREWQPACSHVNPHVVSWVTPLLCSLRREVALALALHTEAIRMLLHTSLSVCCASESVSTASLLIVSTLWNKIPLSLPSSVALSPSLSLDLSPSHSQLLRDCILSHCTTLTNLLVLGKKPPHIATSGESGEEEKECSCKCAVDDKVVLAAKGQLTWLLKALIMRGGQDYDSLIESFLDLFHQACIRTLTDYTQPCKSAYCSDCLVTLFGDGSDTADRNRGGEADPEHAHGVQSPASLPNYLCKGMHCTVSLFYKQRLFSRLFPILLAEVTERDGERETDASGEDSVLPPPGILSAIGVALKNVPFGVVQPHMRHILPILLAALTVAGDEGVSGAHGTMDINTRSVVLDTIHTLICTRECTQEFLPMLSKLIHLLLENTVFKESMHIRLLSLTTLTSLSHSLSPSHLRPYERLVQLDLIPVLDDKKRVVRRAAAKCRNEWYVIGVEIDA